MSACNRFGESILHIACRRSSFEIVKYLVENSESLFLIDDFGRTPLHDAFWSPEPRFEVVALLMNTSLDLIRFQDKRGAIPLQYIRRDQWRQWCAFLESQKEIYWAPIVKNTQVPIKSSTVL